jgi:hypothetical protein
MINTALATRDELRLSHEAVKIQYIAPEYTRWQPQHLSPVAQKVLHDQYPNETEPYLSPSRPEITALRLLDFLSSRQGYIRRKGMSFRTEQFYSLAMPKLIAQIKRGLPIELNSLCLCTTLANRQYAGDSPYPNMGAFIAFENLHKIILGTRTIYRPGINMTLGYEGALFEPLYFHNKSVVRQSLQILQHLNDLAASNIWQGSDNPIEVVDAFWMIEQSFGSTERFTKRVEELAPILPETPSSTAWREWYDKTVSDYFFPSRTERTQFTVERARWREAVLYLKYNEGVHGGGFMNYGNNSMTFTPSGRRQNMLALQLIPENSHLPHQRIITYDSAANKWRTEAYETILGSSEVYAPRYVAEYSYPFYFEKATSSTLLSLRPAELLAATGHSRAVLV